MKSRRRCRSYGSRAGGVSSSLVRTLAYTLGGREGRRLTNPDFSGSKYRPDMLSELGSRQEPMCEEARLELAGVGDARIEFVSSLLDLPKYAPITAG